MSLAIHSTFQSPQWGSNSKAKFHYLTAKEIAFQSPQWGSNSKEDSPGFIKEKFNVSVPAMGK